ncbi:MAG: hypothetical protein IJU20_03265 [Clostridia bacterium]|nr:hypothetical protein [Clostridia bacterium]
MACFTVTVVEAIATTIATKAVEKRERKLQKKENAETGASVGISAEHKIPFSRKLKWLNRMLWGGSALLAFEHLWHGEIVPYFPFLTAASNPEDAAEMLREMGTVGVSMALLVTLVWLGIVGVTALMEKKAAKEDKSETEEPVK